MENEILAKYNPHWIALLKQEYKWKNKLEMLRDLENEVNKGRLAFGDYTPLVETLFVFVNDTHHLIA